MKTEASYTADCKVSNDIACKRILSPEGLKAWWIGKITITNVEDTWPALGTKMQWRAGGAKFIAEVISDKRPLEIIMKVHTPTANTTISHSFRPILSGGSSYTKHIYDPKFHNAISRMLSPFFILMLRAFVKKEVTRAVAYAEIK